MKITVQEKISLQSFSACQNYIKLLYIMLNIIMQWVIFVGPDNPKCLVTSKKWPTLF